MWGDTAHSLSLSLSLSHTHTHVHAHTRAHTHTRHIHRKRHIHTAESGRAGSAQLLCYVLTVERKYIYWYLCVSVCVCVCVCVCVWQFVCIASRLSKEDAAGEKEDKVAPCQPHSNTLNNKTNNNKITLLLTVCILVFYLWSTVRQTDPHRMTSSSPELCQVQQFT